RGRKTLRPSRALSSAPIDRRRQVHACSRPCPERRDRTSPVRAGSPARLPSVFVKRGKRAAPACRTGLPPYRERHNPCKNEARAPAPRSRHRGGGFGLGGRFWIESAETYFRR